MKYVVAGLIQHGSDILEDPGSNDILHHLHCVDFFSHSCHLDAKGQPRARDFILSWHLKRGSKLCGKVGEETKCSQKLLNDGQNDVTPTSEYS